MALEEKLIKDLVEYYQGRVTLAECEDLNDLKAFWVRRYRDDGAFRFWVNSTMMWYEVPHRTF